MTVDLSPIITPLVSAAGIALTILAGWALTKLAQKLGVEKNSAAMANLNTAATVAIGSAVMATQDLIKAKGYDHIDVQNAQIASAANYLVAKFPDTLKASGLDPSTADGVRNIKDAVTARLAAGVAAAAASPTTPDQSITVSTLTAAPKAGT